VERRRKEMLEVSERQLAVNKKLDEKEAALDQREAAVKALEETLSQREAAAKALEDSASQREAAARALKTEASRLSGTLKVREDWVKSREAELDEQAKQLRAGQAALEQLKLEAAQQALAESQAQLRADLHHFADWAGEANTALVPLGLSPIQVPELPSTMADALPVLRSAMERLRRLDSTLAERLEAEGRDLLRAVAEYLLVCFRSHDPAISLDPVVVGPVEETEAAARESVQEVVEIVAARFQRAPVDEELDAPEAGVPPAP